jgi:hypothetical protein
MSLTWNKKTPGVIKLKERHMQSRERLRGRPFFLPNSQVVDAKEKFLKEMEGTTRGWQEIETFIADLEKVLLL